ncbi:hypothetical protein VNO77_20315 [Canavalia gladiata]|uniref:Uncharacterized protein n=1 Tax=Canavalia gladiata TaxID=3824 RepID=A0AAN9LT93_CANGL
MLFSSRGALMLEEINGDGQFSVLRRNELNDMFRQPVTRFYQCFDDFVKLGYKAFCMFVFGCKLDTSFMEYNNNLIFGFIDHTIPPLLIVSFYPLASLLTFAIYSRCSSSSIHWKFIMISPSFSMVSRGKPLSVAIIFFFILFNTSSYLLSHGGSKLDHRCSKFTILGISYSLESLFREPTFGLGAD